MLMLSLWLAVMIARTFVLMAVEAVEMNVLAAHEDALIVAPEVVSNIASWVVPQIVDTHVLRVLGKI